MTPIPLSSFVEGIGQEEAAKSLGSSQTAICKALKTGRLIFVTEKPCGSFEAIELKGFPSAGPNHKARPDPEQILDQVARLAQASNMAVNSYSTQQAPP
ncbi:Cro/CI family transcriptional regulator [Pseudomonas sp. ICMP 8385]|uniref:Cro/CI family transcriptional regulator n=1 Tax=Pseudomonas sp. ICMP 8385 TaxID=1718920 RepID=UPI000C088AF5|nr:Cro/CI family transcriptional regulator [Pseudomonas sp. ICMP 8385]